MTYITGTISDGNAASALYAVLAPALTSAGYTLVDTVVISTRTHKIWKSPAASNAIAKDWFLDVAYSTSGVTNFSFWPMEFFDPATDLAYRMVTMGINSTVIDATTYSRFGATGNTLEAAAFGTNASNTTNLNLSLSASSFGYWISVTADRVIAMSSQAVTSVLYAGLYTTIEPHKSHVGVDAFPLTLALLTANSSAAQNNNSAGAGSAGLTRIPKVTSLVTTYATWEAYPYIAPILPPAVAGELPRLPDGSTAILGARYALPYLVSMNSTSGAANPSLISSGQMGMLMDIGIAHAAPTVTRGDTMTQGGQTWVLSSYDTGGNASALIFKAA